MALSQVQCLDDNNVNPRTHESKPEFLYCEDQRLALETLLQDGREAYFKCLEARGLRGFLSDLEMETLTGAQETYDPGSEIFPEDAEEGEPPLSQHYWPELSDTSIPPMDLGWPDTDAYRGVTRTTVYSQPPLDGQAHIKEIVRKMIAQAQRVIAVVMDIFTDVDIFRDLLDAGFKRRISVYILLEQTTLPHFLSMCQRANMHAGHLKHLRVRCTGGANFYTRSSVKVTGRMGHRFMFIDGDKAVSGTYSFTWMSTRLDGNHIAVVTGQAVDAFDRLFRILYGTSNLVDLRQVATEPEPEPEPLPQIVSLPPLSAALARKLYNPKYALAIGSPSPSSSPSPTPSAGHTSPKNTESLENSRNREVPDPKKRRRRRASIEAIQEPPIHPGLTNLEKACLMSYLPTWPDPDPASDVIGFINIRDTNKPNQAHLQRSEMFGISQAIKFSSPFSTPEETLPEMAKPRQLTAKYEEVKKLQPARDKTKNKESVEDRSERTQLKARHSEAKAPEQNSHASGPKSKFDKDAAKTFNTKDKVHSNTPTKTTPHTNAHAPAQPSSKPSTPKTGRPSHTTQAVKTNNPQPDSLSGLIAEREAGISLNTQSAVAYKTHNLLFNSTQNSHLCGPADSNTGEHIQGKTVVPHTDSHVQAVHTQPQNSSEMTPNIQSPTVNSVSPSSTSAVCSQSVSSTSLSENNHISNPTSMTTTACATLSSVSASSSSLPPLISSSTTLISTLPSSSTSPSLTSAPPIPKPRTIQLVITDRVTRSVKKTPNCSIIRRPETHNESAVETMARTTPEKEPEANPELQNDSESKTGAKNDVGNTANIREDSQQKQSGTFQETKNEEAVGLHDDRTGMQLVAGTNLEARSDVLITDAPKAETVNIQNVIPKKDVEPKTLTSIDCKLNPKKDCVATVQAGTKAPESALTGCEFTEVPDKNSKNVTLSKTYCTNSHELQRISYNALTPQDIGVLDTVDSFKAQTHDPGAVEHNPHASKDGAGDSTHTSATDTNVQQGNPSSTESTSQEITSAARGSAHTNEKSLRLPLSDTHMRDLRSLTPERESQPHKALVRTPTPDGFLPRTPTSDSRTHTPDSRSYPPDFRTPTPDVSDEYVTPRPESALSTNSEEYYECSESPLHEPVSDRSACCNRGTTEVTITHTNTPIVTAVTTGPAYLNYNSSAATLGTTDKNISGSETQSLSEPASISSSSSLLEKQVKMGGKEKTANTESGREVDEKGRKLSVVETRTEGDSRETQKRGREEAKRTAEDFKQGNDLTETVQKNKEAEPQAHKRKRVLNQSAAERSVNGGVTPRDLPNEGAQPKRWSTGDLKLKKVFSEGERPDKEKAVDRAALGPSGVERKGRSQSTREIEGQKLFHSPPKPPQGLLKEGGVSSPSRPSRARSLSANQSLGPRPWGGRQPNQAESKALHSTSKVMDNTSSPRRPPSRPPPPMAAGAVGSTAGQKQAEVSHSPQSPLSQQPPAAQGRARAGQSPNRHPKPQASPLLHPRSQNQTASAQEVQSQEEGKGPFSFTISRLYSLKGLKDKMNKLPAQSKKGSTSSPIKGHKSKS